ncbi:MAG: hypothetical protein JWQ02_4147, partial [Capsulimonas sp.]|nr:hypothetical protein [Capsulimonas sp.]
LGWIANVLLIWRPVGLDMPVLWPVAMLIALQASSLAVRYRPTLPTHIVNTFLMLIWVFLMMTPKIREPFSDVELAAGFLVLGGWMYITTLDGAAKTRRGETWAIFPKRERRVHQRPIAPFASSVRAQAWMERRNYLPMLAVMIAGNSLLSLMMSFAAPFTGEIWPITLLTHFSHHIYARSGFSTGPFTPLVSLPFFSLLLLTVMTMIRARNKSTPPFSPVLPIDSSTWVAAKLRVFAEGTRVIWATQILLWLIWATVPAWMDGKPIPVGIALWNSLKPQMDAHDAFALAALLIGLAFLTWKVQTDHLFLIATFRSPLLCVAGALVVCAAYLTVCAAAYPISIEGIHAFAFKVPHWSPISPQRKMLADNILVIGTPVKLALTAYLLTVLRRRGHLSASNLRRTLALWSTIALLFIVLFGFALSPYQIAWYQSALGVLFFMPGVRLSLAPLALAWDRSR